VRKAWRTKHGVSRLTQVVQASCRRSHFAFPSSRLFAVGASGALKCRHPERSGGCAFFAGLRKRHKRSPAGAP